MSAMGLSPESLDPVLVRSQEHSPSRVLFIRMYFSVTSWMKSWNRCALILYALQSNYIMFVYSDIVMSCFCQLFLPTIKQFGFVSTAPKVNSYQRMSCLYVKVHVSAVV